MNKRNYKWHWSFMKLYSLSGLRTFPSFPANAQASGSVPPSRSPFRSADGLDFLTEDIASKSSWPTMHVLVYVVANDQQTLAPFLVRNAPSRPPRSSRGAEQSSPARPMHTITEASRTCFHGYTVRP
ncbi:hypothetical protein PAXINDRAFT_8547 [Paxillus involutus ATCC 200175]|nr:hypothetical protein PAXINDRAFT_8547 [Paxillus involutus ATCC 200175]